jgi:hypothetical protein
MMVNLAIVMQKVSGMDVEEFIDQMKNELRGFNPGKKKA